MLKDFDSVFDNKPKDIKNRFSLENEELDIDDITDSFGGRMVWVPQKKISLIDKKGLVIKHVKQCSFRHLI